MIAVGWAQTPAAQGRTGTVDDEDSLNDRITLRLSSAYWRLSEQTSGAAQMGIDAIRRLLRYADEVEFEVADGWVHAERIRREIAEALEISLVPEVKESE